MSVSSLRGASFFVQVKLNVSCSWVLSLDRTNHGSFSALRFSDSKGVYSVKQDSDSETKSAAPSHYGLGFGDRLALWYDRNAKFVNVLLVLILAGIAA